MYTILKPQAIVPKAPQDQFNSYISIPLDVVTVNLWLNGGQEVWIPINLRLI